MRESIGSHEKHCQARRAQWLWLLLLVCFPITALTAQQASVHGYVFIDSSGAPLSSASISIIGHRFATRSDSTGFFRLDHLPAGKYLIQFSHIGFESLTIGPFELASGTDTGIVAQLGTKPVSVRDIVVTPGTFAIMGNEPVVSQTLTRNDIQSIPHFGEDIYRAVSRLPGVSSNDFSARFSVRGSEHEQILALFDGLQLYEPFHLRDVDGGALSIVDVDLIQGVELMTGGFSAMYGDRLGGVFSITPRPPLASQYRATAGLSFTDARVSAEGPFADGRGTWLISARRGYVDLVLKFMEQDTAVSPVYYDTYTNLRYRLSSRHLLSISTLYASDRLRYLGEQQDSADTRYANANLWIKLQSEINHRFAITSAARIGDLTHHRNGISYDRYNGLLRYDVADYRRFRYVELKQDYEFDASRSLLFQTGFEMQESGADYDYRSYYTNNLGENHSYTRSLQMSPRGRQFGAYISESATPYQFLTIQLGIRYDNVSYTSDRLFSPRSSVALRLNSTSSLRFAWGRYTQSEGMFSLDVPDGDSTFYPADIAEHRVVGFEHRFNNGIHTRIEAYYRGLGRIRPRYRNLALPLNAFVEAQPDRTKLIISEETARGVEIYFRTDPSRPLSFWASYAYAKITDHVERYTYNGLTIDYNKDAPGSLDQRHTIYVDVSCKLGRQWRVNAAWQFHTGVPYTNYLIRYDTTNLGVIYPYAVLEEPYSSRFPDYHRLDMRISRVVEADFGTLSFFLEIVNLYNRRNLRAFENYYSCDGTTCVLKKTPYYWFRLLPSLGLSWRREF